MPDELIIEWDDYHRKLEQLARLIRDSDINPDQIFCIAKGGMRVGDILARIFKLPLAILAIESYANRKDPRTPGRVLVAESLTSTQLPLGRRILLVDDLVDRGPTLKEALTWLSQRHGAMIEAIWTAVIWYKQRSIFKPDFFVEFLEGDDPPWIVQPFERYDHLGAEDL